MILLEQALVEIRIHQTPHSKELEEIHIHMFPLSKEHEGIHIPLIHFELELGEIHIGLFLFQAHMMTQVLDEIHIPYFEVSHTVDWVFHKMPLFSKKRV